jgi:hypothetical protein
LGGYSHQLNPLYVGLGVMTQTDFFQLYIATIAILGGLSGFVITHLLAEIKRLNTRVDEIYNILLER